MNRLWNGINKLNYAYEMKIRIFLALNSIIYGLLGLAAWILIRNAACFSAEYIICFVGYPGFFIGYLGGFIFLSRQ